MADDDLHEFHSTRGTRSEIADTRSCTCHPDDNPPVPCPRKYALDECRKAVRSAERVTSRPATLAESLSILLARHSERLSPRERSDILDAITVANERDTWKELAQNAEDDVKRLHKDKMDLLDEKLARSAIGGKTDV